MKVVGMLFVIMLSATIVWSHPQYAHPCDKSLTYPLPTVELKYLNDLFTKDLIIKKSFKDNERVPIRIELIKPQMNDGEANDLYLTIESVQVSFAIHEDVALKSGTYQGHLVFIPISWPPGFKLEQGSRIVFVVKYNYLLKGQIVEKGEVIEQIRFEIAHAPHFLVHIDSVSYSSAYSQDQADKLKGFVVGSKAHEKYVIYFNGQWIMSFNGEAYKIYFEVDRLPHWEATGYIREFAIYRKTFFGQKKVSFEVPYNGAKKYLVISRERKRSKRQAFIGTWSDEEPELPPVKY